MKIAFYDQTITPEQGTEIAGYAPHDIARGIHDPLYVNMLLLDDGENKALMLGFDLLGIDEDWCNIIRNRCAAELGIPEENVILSCTHTHSGPQSRSINSLKRNEQYLDTLLQRVLAGMDHLNISEEVSLYIHSVNCDANINRRVIMPDGKCRFLPVFRELTPLADGFCDREIGMVFFVGKNNNPVHMIVNYAAHPLCSHCPGTGSFMFSADYPGALRRIIKEETGANCLFISGACGDLFPKNFETGFGGVEKMGSLLADEVLAGLAIAIRHKDETKIAEPIIKCSLEKDTYALKPEKAEAMGLASTQIQLGLQFLALGKEVCFIGVPGELLAELGQEMKWHSPYRKTFILYNSTGYIRYISHAHTCYEGGYEAGACCLKSSQPLKMVMNAVDGMNRLNGVAHL